ncbi:DUF1129 family protein [Bacillus sp. N9]
MNAKKLIEENNRKRELLTPANEAYYSDMLIYIRLQLTLSERQSEEVLMEMLDHLLDGQQDGKTAKDIFGHDPKAYADEIIEQLPKEKNVRLSRFCSELQEILLAESYSSAAFYFCPITICRGEFGFKSICCFCKLISHCGLHHYYDLVHF